MEYLIFYASASRIAFTAFAIKASSIAFGESSTVFTMAARTSAAASFSIARRDAASSARRAASAFLSSSASFLFASARSFASSTLRVALCFLQNTERLRFRLFYLSLPNLFYLAKPHIGLFRFGKPLFYCFSALMEHFQERLVGDKRKTTKRIKKLTAWLKSRCQSMPSWEKSWDIMARIPYYAQRPLADFLCHSVANVYYTNLMINATTNA